MENEFKDLELEKVFSITLSNEYIKGLIEISELLSEGIIPVEEIEKELEKLQEKEKEKNASKTR